MRRVAVTGLGIVSPLGNDVGSFWASACAGNSGIGPLPEEISRGLRVKIAAQVADFDAATQLPGVPLASLDRFSQFALAAARQAWAGLGGPLRDAERSRCAVIFGSGAGGVGTYEETARRTFSEGARRVHPLSVPKFMINAAASQISMHLGVHGPVLATSTACSTANHAIGLGFHMVRSGLVDLAVVGASEACLTPLTLRCWEALRVMADDTCRPFSKGRRGMVLGEGAGALLLEDYERATRRGAHVHALISGFGMSADAGDLVLPSAEGAARALRAALEDAELDPQEIDYINAHGTGTAANDVVETRAVRTVFGSHADSLIVSATKSMTGHSLGAAGALEAVATVCSLETGIVHPTVNFLEPDPECDLDVVPNSARQRSSRAALSNSFAFGGLNAVLAFCRAA